MMCKINTIEFRKEGHFYKVAYDNDEALRRALVDYMLDPRVNLMRYDMSTLADLIISQNRV